MLGWILGLVTQAGNSVAGVANAAAQRILAVFNFVINYFLRVRGATVLVYTMVRGWLAAYLAHVLAVLNTLKWVAITWVPKLLATLAAKITAWVAGLVTFTQLLARQLIANAEARLLAGLASLSKLVGSIEARLLLLYFNTAARLDRIENRLFGLLGSADRIVAYIVASMVKALGRWALANAAAVGRIGWRFLLGNVGSVVGSVEDIITRII